MRSLLHLQRGSVTRALVTGLTVFASLDGCRTAPSFSSSGPEPTPVAADVPPSGVRYYTGHDLLVVDADVTFRRGTRWTAKDPADSTPCTADKPFSKWVSTRWNVSTLAVPDRSRAYRLGLVGGSSVQQALNVGVSETGLLSTLNATTHDQTGDVFVNVLKGVAGVVGSVAGIRGAVGLEENKKAVPTNEECFKAAAAATDSRIKQLGEDLQTTRASRVERLREAARQQVTRETLLRLRAQDSLLAQREALLENSLATLRTARAAKLATFLQEAEIAEADTVVHLRYVIDPSELPGTALATWKEMRTAATDGTIRRMMLDSARLALIMREPDTPAGQIAGQAPVKGGSSFGCADPSSKDCARIFFRAPVTRILEVYTPLRDADAAAPVLRERSAVSLVTLSDPVQSVAFDGARFADAGLKLAFGKYGNVTSLEQSRGSSLAGASAAVTNALSGARQELVSGLKSVQDFQTAAQAIRDNRADARLRDLKRQKDLIDAEVALRGASATQDLLDEKHRIDAEIQLLQSQQSLATTQADGARATDLADLKDQIARLQVQIELLQKQLDLEKEKKALADAKP